MLYTVDVNSTLMNEFKKEVRENGENENEVLSALLREYLEDLRDAKELDRAIEESDGKFYSLNDVIKELGFENDERFLNQF